MSKKQNHSRKNNFGKSGNMNPFAKGTYNKPDFKNNGGGKGYSPGIKGIKK